MRILFVGKYPPLQGGVSSSTYRLAQGLAKRGHHIDVITNAKDAALTEKFFLEKRDMKFIKSDSKNGSVRVHWTEPQDKSQRHIPNDNPIVTKLVSLGLNTFEKSKPDAIFSFYLEPYSVAGYTLSQLWKVPHIVRTAGSDAGRLWHHPQLKPLYLEILKNAATIWTGATFAKEIIKQGISREKIYGKTFANIPEDTFKPKGPKLNVGKALLRSSSSAKNNNYQKSSTLPKIGIYGKLAVSKGVFDLLPALSSMKSKKLAFHLILCGDGMEESKKQFLDLSKSLKLTNQISRIDFIPYWRVPEFIRNCDIICCLEQNFPIVSHSPIIAREVLMCGATLVASTEILQKLPKKERLIHGFNCYAIEDISHTKKLSDIISKAISPNTHNGMLQKEARSLAIEMQTNIDDISQLENILKASLSENPRNENTQEKPFKHDKNDFCELIQDQIIKTINIKNTPLNLKPLGTISWGKQLSKMLHEFKINNDVKTNFLKDTVDIWLLIKRLSSYSTTSTPNNFHESLFRLNHCELPTHQDEFLKLVPVVKPNIFIKEFNFSADKIITAILSDTLPELLPLKPSTILAATQLLSQESNLIVLDNFASEIIKSCNGKNTLQEIISTQKDNFRKEAYATLREFLLSDYIRLQYQ